MRSFCSFLLVLACSLLLIPPAQAQSGKGAITGRVTDSSGGALIGAQISAQPTGVTVASDAQGQFFINDLDPGYATILFREFCENLWIAAVYPEPRRACLR